MNFLLLKGEMFTVGIRESRLQASLNTLREHTLEQTINISKRP